MADWLTRTVRTAGIERALKAGQVLFRAGQRTTGLFEVTSGSVRLVRVDRTGRETVLYVAVSGETLAEASLFASEYHCDAIAVTDSVVRLYPKDKMLREFERNSAVAQAFMAILAQQVMNLRTRLEQRNIHSAHDRVWHYFALNLRADGCTVKVPGTLKDLARPNSALPMRLACGVARAACCAALVVAALHLYCSEFDPNQRGLFRRGNHELSTELAPRQKLDQAGPARMWREI